MRDALAADHANLLAALRSASESGDTDLGLTMAGRMWRFWQLRGHFAEGRWWLSELLARADDTPAVARVKGLIGLAGLAYWEGDLDGAETAYRQAHDAARSLGDWWQVLVGCRAYGERWYEGQTLRTLALVALLQERYEQAEQELRGSLDIAREAGDAAGMAMDLDRLGQAAIALGQPERAVTLTGAASRLREHAGGGLTVQHYRWETEHPRDAARRILTPSEVDVAWARGRSMRVDDAVAYAHKIETRNATD